MLQLHQYSKHYQDYLVLAIEDLVISPGVHWLKGDNGSGKTTLFKSLAGIIPFQGTVKLHDVDAKLETNTYRKMVNYGEAEPLFPGFLTAKDLVGFVGKARNSPKREQEYYSRRMGITSFFSQPCGTFSSGMMKRLSLVLAFLGNPKLIILDEPQVTLDEASRNVLIRLILEKLQDPKVVVLLSSHQSIDHGALPFSETFVIQEKKLIRS